MRRSLAGRRLVAVAIVAIAAIFAACTNDPFDPESVANRPPTVQFFATPVDDAELNPTSYFSRTFHWSGNDADGQVVSYDVSIRTDAAVPAPWVTTTRTDTTMTFTTDDLGEAEATFYLVARDDRGALSDTLVRFVPLRNFPPAVNFQSDFDPLRNLQREFVMDGDTVVDTVYWNWGAMNVRCFALDIDGAATMDTFYRYTTATPVPANTVPFDDPRADPDLFWVAVPFAGSGEIREFSIELDDVAPGERTLTVAVGDEAEAETTLELTWEVREPRGPVLVIPDNSGGLTREFYGDILAGYFGEDGWDEYEFWFGFPDSPFVLLETMRKFEAVFWYGSGTSAILERAANRDGALERYVDPLDGADPGRLLMVSRNLTGSNSGLPFYFRQTVLGVSPTGAPASALEPEASAIGVQALGAVPGLPPMTLVSTQGRGVGLSLLDGSEELYRFEECLRCFGRRPPFDPIIAARRPARDVEALARVVGVSFQLEFMDPDEVAAALAAILADELGVPAP
jgi:hypothetical protein